MHLSVKKTVWELFACMLIYSTSIVIGIVVKRVYSVQNTTTRIISPRTNSYCIYDGYAPA